MSRLISFRPDVISNGSAFEAMSSIYKFLQEKHSYRFLIIKDEKDNYFDPQLEVLSISRKDWQSNKFTTLAPSIPSRKSLERYFTQADGILTVDPTVYQQGCLAIQTAHRCHKPIWFDTSRTDLGNDLGATWKLRRKSIRSACQKAQGIIATVPKCLERFQNMGLFNETIAQKFYIMGHPVNTEEFKPLPKLSDQDGILRILVVSRLVPEKGLYYILEALTPILWENPNIRLQLLGNGPMKPLLQREVAERQLSSKVDFMDPVPHSKLAAILGQADIFINHAVAISHWEEFFGAANLEAMACGLPCILSDCGGIPYAVRDPNAAMLINERSIAQIRQTVETLSASKERRLQLGQQARQYVKQNYDLPVIAERYHRMLQSSLDH